MPHERLRPRFIFTEERLAQLREVVPEAFADGKIDWTSLREALGNWLEETEEEAEHFGLTWPGKREARRIAAMPSQGTLVPMPGEGVDEDTTRNLFIEGDNLEVLKLLQKSYAGRVKMIYIDPPYNTGNDFVYEDDFAEPIETYLRRTAQLDEEGKALTTNTRADGRFHSKWLSMMYPRLRLARSLLADEGMLFVSIDDSEVHNCRQIMNEIYGEECFVESFVWKKSYGGGAKEKYAVRQHEYVLLYCKNREALPELWLPPDAEAEARYYKYRDDNYEERGPYRLKPLEASKSMDARPNLKYAIPSPHGPVLPRRQWWWSKERTMKALENDEIVFTKTNNGVSVTYKQYLRGVDGEVRGAKPFSVLDGPYTQEGTRDLSALFDGDLPLQFPKPVALIEQLMRIGAPASDGGIVLDFFFGSGTTGQAVFSLNRSDGGTRRFIGIQLPEPMTGAKYPTIAAVAKERLRRASKHIKKDKNPTAGEDLGFRVLKLERSAYRVWRNYEGDNLNRVIELFANAEDTLVDDWTSEGLLTEVMLLEGFPLDSEVEVLKGFRQNRVSQVTSDHSAHKLVACFDNRLYADTFNALDLRDTDVFVCLDRALTDETKIRLADRCLLKTI
jgi:adenine-specific DNA-methyltransferase